MASPAYNTTTEFTHYLLAGHIYVISAEGTGGVWYVPTTGTPFDKAGLVAENNFVSAVISPNADCTMRVYRGGSIVVQVQDITHRSALSTAPDEFIDPDTDYGTGVNGFRYFTTALANTVDGSGVVTEATGAALTGIALANVPGATNLFTYSAISDGTGWVQASTSLSSALAPDGTNDAALFADNSAGGTGTPSLRSGLITVSTLTSYVVSVYAKSDQLSWLSMRTFGFTSGDGESFFDLSSATVGTKSANHAASSVDDVGGGWCRCSIVFTTDAADTYGYVYFYVAESDSNRIIDLDGTSSILIWGAQVEQGTIPTPYIPTSGSTASTDSAILDFSGVTGFVAPNEMRIVCTGLGPNIVTGGDFSNPADWTKGAGVTIADGVVEFTGTSVTNCNQIYDFTDGDRYLVIFSVVEYTSGNFRPYIGANNTASISSAGLKSLVIESNGYDYINIYTSASFIGKIDDLQVYKIDPTDTTERIIDVDNWDGTDLSDILPHANIISVTQYAPGERP